VSAATWLVVGLQVRVTCVFFTGLYMIANLYYDLSDYIKTRVAWQLLRLPEPVWNKLPRRIRAWATNDDVFFNSFKEMV
jgi:hypothetical protein